MPRAILTVGIAGSGKTTWSNKVVANNSDWININRDSLRESQGFPPIGDAQQEKLVTKLQRGLVEVAGLEGFNVIISDTNLNKDVRNGMVRYLHKQGFDVEFKIFDVPYDVCVERNNARPNPVPEKVMKKQHDRFVNLPILLDLPISKFDQVSWHGGKEFVVTVDLDGTVAEHVARSPYEYDKVSTDELIGDVASVVDALSNLYKIIFVSGRPDSCRADTEDWIENYFDFPYELHMRKAGDDRADWIVKSELYDEHILPNYNVLVSLDDRQQVVNHMRSRGLTVLQVRPGRF